MKKWFVVFMFIKLITIKQSDLDAGNLPAYLPFDTNAISNSTCQITIALQYTMIGGGLNTATISDTDYFETLRSYNDRVATLAGYLVSTIITRSDIASGIRFKMICYNTDSNGSITRYYTDKDIGNIDTINYQSFLNIVPSVSSVNLNIQNLSYVEAISSTSTNLINASANQVAIENPNPSERTRYIIVLNDGESAVYTQTGDQLVEPVLSINMSTNEWWPFYWPGKQFFYNYDFTNDNYTYTGPPPIILKYGQATIFATPGADTIVETSTDMVEWNVVAYLPWNSGSSNISVNNWPPDYGNYYYNFGTSPTVDQKWFVRAYSY